MPDMNLSGDELLDATISEVVEVVENDHAELTHLDYASSGHTGFQPTISDLATIRTGASAGATAYQKPVSGIPSTDLSSGVQNSLEKADSALQEHQSLASYRTSAAQDTIDSGKQDKLTAGENITIENNVISASGGGVSEWGDITGTLSNQTDLQTALNAKQDTIPANTYDAYGSAASAVSTHNSASDAHSSLFAAKQDALTSSQLAAVNSGISSADKTKLDGIEAGAEVNIVDDVTVNGTSVVSGGTAAVVAAPPCLTGSGSPTTSTVGEVGQLYIDTFRSEIYICKEVSNGSYTWQMFSNVNLFKNIIKAGSFGNWGVVYGFQASNEDYGVSIGTYAKATGHGTIQLGNGTNNEAGTFCVGIHNEGNFKMLDGTTGLIPPARYCSKQTATINVADWNNKIATCSITGLRVDSDTTQKVECFFTDNATMLSAKPWFSCSTAGTLTVTCQGTVPDSAITVIAVLTEI